MKKIAVLLLLIIIPIITYAATFNSYDQIKTELQSIMQLKRATNTAGQRVIVVKFEGQLQDFSVRHCHIFNIDEVLGNDPNLALNTSFESYGSFIARNPETPLGSDEYLCWSVYVTAIWLDTTGTVAINLTTNEPVILEPNLRCDTSRPFDGGGRVNSEGWGNWFHLQNVTNDSPIVAKCMEQNGNATISYREPSLNVDGSVLDDLAGIKIYYEVENGGTTARHLATTIPASSPQGGQNISQRIFIPVSGPVNLTAYAYDFSNQHSPPSNTAQFNVAVKWSNTNIALNVH